MVNASKEAAIRFEKKYKAPTETKDDIVPKISACFLVSFPVGIGLKQVLVIKASKSDSYHIFKHPAAPEPSATKIIHIIALSMFMFALEVNSPTAHVNITRDITLGFINNSKDFI